MLKIVWNGQNALHRREQTARGSPATNGYPTTRRSRPADLARLGHDPVAHGIRRRLRQARAHRRRRRDGHEPGRVLARRHPDDFQQKPGTKSRRIADQARIDISQLTIEPSPNVLGYGVTVINGSYPDPVKTPGFPNAFTAGVTRPAPRGVQKFEWNPDDRRFVKAWINPRSRQLRHHGSGRLGSNGPALLRRTRRTATTSTSASTGRRAR